MFEDFEAVINSLLLRCYNGFYPIRPNPEREFHRDLPKLRMAILRYGKECSDRGWEFDLDHFGTALNALLKDVLHRSENIQHLPTYLDGAVTRHINQRADELNAKAKVEMGMDRVVGRVLADVKRETGKLVAGPRPASATEIASQLWQQMRDKSRQKAKASAAKRTANKESKQPTLL